MLRTTLLWLTLTATAVSCGEVSFLDLATPPTLKSIALNGCNKYICPIYNGERIHFIGTFVANQDSNTFQGLTWGFVNGTVYQFSNYTTDGCVVGDENTYLEPHGCPLRKGRTYSLNVIWTPDGMITGTKILAIGYWWGDRGYDTPVLYAASQYTVVNPPLNK